MSQQLHTEGCSTMRQSSNHTVKSTIQMKKTNVGYPNCIPNMHGWQYVLQTPSGPKSFSNLNSARVFADRIARMILPNKTKNEC